jgi:hypothetical protein
MSINVGRQVNLTDFHRDHGLGNAATPLPAALVRLRNSLLLMLIHVNICELQKGHKSQARN